MHCTGKGIIFKIDKNFVLKVDSKNVTLRLLKRVVSIQLTYVYPATSHKINLSYMLNFYFMNFYKLQIFPLQQIKKVAVNSITKDDKYV